MNAESAVAAAWRDLVRRHGCEVGAAASALAELVNAYAQPHRRYHTLDHVVELLGLLAEQQVVSDRDAVALTILFHDVVYDPMRQDNEAASAARAENRLGELGFPPPLVAKVGQYVRATQHGQTAAGTDDADLDLLLDLDLSVLASGHDRYRAYAEAIRQEYAAVPDDLYRSGRRRVLENFLARDRIYRSEHLHPLWERSARENLAREITDLS
jgi:predicted metal-dependent HD superfamily phosphohydrolase